MPGFTVGLSAIQRNNLSITVDFVNKQCSSSTEMSLKWNAKLIFDGEVDRVAISSSLSLIFHKARQGGRRILLIENQLYHGTLSILM